MKSLDIEPPSKFEGNIKKEANKKKNGTSSSLIVFLKGNKNKIIFEKNLEKKVISDKQKNIFNFDYIKNEGYSIEENLTITNKSIDFTKTESINSSKIIADFNYDQKISNIGSKEKKILNFYNLNSSYSFIPKIKEEYKNEELSSQTKEQETKEISYPLYNLDGETEQENQNGL